MSSTAARKKQSKDRRQAKNAETAKLRAVQEQLDRINQEKDLLQPFPSLRTYVRRGLQLEISCKHAADLGPSELEWMYALCRSNMEALYQPVWGWHPREKRQQLQDASARYLIASAHPGQEGNQPQPVAFVHFRFECSESAMPIMYIWEVQLERQVQCKGLGQFLMMLLKLLAKRQQLSSIQLTVLDANEAAVGLYRKLGYQLDPTSPSQADPTAHMEEPTGYEIMSLQLEN